MLNECAPGHTFKPMPHKFKITWNGRTFPSLQKGPHGKDNPEIQIGNVKQMIKHLGINMECAKKYLALG